MPVRDFRVSVDGVEKSILDVDLEAPSMDENADNLELSEYLVRVEWIKTLPMEQAIWEKGMYANQNSVTKFRNKFTLERLTERFELDKETV